MTRIQRLVCNSASQCRKLCAAALLSLVATAAYAGHYSVSYYGTGAVYAYPSGSTPYFLQSDGSWGVSPHGFGVIQCSGTITAHYTWVPDVAGEPPPCYAVVKETCEAYVAYTPPGSVSNGLGDPQVGGISGMNNGVLIPHYTLKKDPGYSFDGYTRSPYAVPVYHQFWAMSVLYKGTATPIYIDSQYAVHANGLLNFQVGQQADFYVQGSGLTFDNYQWHQGHHRITSVTFGTQHDSSSFTNWHYYDSRTTNYMQDMTVAHPSWYYEGAGSWFNVRCDCRVSVGTTVLGNVTLYRWVALYRPVVQWDWFKYHGTIWDTYWDNNTDTELERAGSKADGIPGVQCFATLRVDPLFTNAQGTSHWSYVQLCQRSFTSDLSSFSEAWGLDNTYPYGYYDRTTQDFAAWADAGPVAREFQDSPDVSITGCDSYSDSFAAQCFVVLRPAVYAGQSYVDMPIRWQRWTYSSSSTRPGWMWMSVAGYTEKWLSGGTLVYETTPSSSSILFGDSDLLAYSIDMDWSTTVQNGQ